MRIGTEIDFPLVDTLVEEGLLTSPSENWVKDVIRPALARTPYRHRWNINRYVKIGYLNFYFLKPKFAAETKLPAEVVRYRDELVGNCAYLGEHGIVICDSDFLRSFAYAHGLPNQSTDPTNHELGFEGIVNERLELVNMWVLGHEIGHVINGDGEADVDEATRLDGTSSNHQTLQELRTTKDKEYAADLTFARNVGLDKAREAALISMLIDLINAELESRYGKPDVYYAPGFELDYAQSKIAYYFDNDPKRTHPEYIVRAVRILQQIAANTKDLGLQALLHSFSYKLKRAD